MLTSCRRLNGAECENASSVKNQIQKPCASENILSACSHDTRTRPSYDFWKQNRVCRCFRPLLLRV